MAQVRSDLPRMQKQSLTRAPLKRSAAAAEKAKPAQPKKPPMMRQYDLIERVRRYNPDTNEALLNHRAIPISRIRLKSRPSSPISSSTTPQLPPRCCTIPSKTPPPPAQTSISYSAPTSAPWSKA
jgi:hypothetical protein